MAALLVAKVKVNHAGPALDQGLLAPAQRQSVRGYLRLKVVMTIINHHHFGGRDAAHRTDPGLPLQVDEIT